ncbi:hypothetical protein F0562_015302 [Nyssa sinensis]|uniref:Uncharacterized protein n=1 Tax=Nyssa sinensis TaxID=561372 RepID=A0A5J4ZGN4_9ASTE|nr:hypothetical protein F0562_015302 [Nyssa sinensis]
MQGDALTTKSAHRPAIRSSASAAGAHSVEGSFGDGAPITLPASAVCTRETISNTNGLEPTIHSTLGIRDTPNVSPDVVCHVANQIGGTPLVSTSDAATQPASFTQDSEQPNNYDIQMIKTMEIGATNTATFLDNFVSTSANASQPENSTKITEQQETPYAIQPIKPMEIATTSRDPLLDCPDILQRESYQNPSGQDVRLVTSALDSSTMEAKCGNASLDLDETGCIVPLACGTPSPNLLACEPMIAAPCEAW